MWQIILGQLAKQGAKQRGREIAKRLFNIELNKPEAYADRIKREFKLRDYAQAWALYDSDRHYWENLYGDDPLNSPNRPASLPKSLIPTPPNATEPGYNLLNPARMAADFGPFGTQGQFAPGSASSSRPLYDTESFGTPLAPMSPADTITGGNMPSRRLVGRIADRPSKFDERFQAALPPTDASPSAADELEAFRRQWLREFLGR